MSQASVSYRWDSGEELQVDVYVEDSFPDAVAEAKAQALSLFKSALGEMTSDQQT